ncbi:WhiB family transcriptional regulator [Microbacterium hydrothermale]
MRYVCARCPLLNLCRDYATASKPKAGFWAGAHYGKGTGA